MLGWRWTQSFQREFEIVMIVQDFSFLRNELLNNTCVD